MADLEALELINETKYYIINYFDFFSTYFPHSHQVTKVFKLKRLLKISSRGINVKAKTVKCQDSSE